MGLRFASALTGLWLVRGHFGEGRLVLDACLAQKGAAAPSPARANALYVNGLLVMVQADLKGAQALHEESLVVSRQLGDLSNIARALENLGLVMRLQGDLAVARAYLEESLAMQRQQANPKALAMCLVNFAAVVGGQGDLVGAQALLEESLAQHRQIGNPRNLSMCLLNIGSSGCETR